MDEYEDECDEERDDEQPSEADPFTVLGVSRDAPPLEIRAAYFALVRAHPPERDAEGFKRIHAAYEQLRSPRKRAQLTLLELRQTETEFDLGRLHDAPAPPFPAQWLDHLVAIALAGVDAEIDALVAARRAALPQTAAGEDGK